MRPNCANICNLAYTDNLYENLQTRQKYLNAKYNSLEIFWHEIPLIRKGRRNRTDSDISKPWRYNDLFLEIMNKPLFLNKGKHIYCCRHFLEHGESSKGGWGDSGVCCFKECTMPQIILWNLLFCTNENFGICVLEQKQSHLPTPAPLLLVILLFFPLVFTAIKSECSLQVSTFTS